MVSIDEPLEIPTKSKAGDYVSIALCISSDRLDPQSITQRLGIQPTSTRFRGTPIRPGMLRRAQFDFHEWWLRKELTLSGRLLDEKEAELFISGFLSGLMSAAGVIRVLSEDHSVSVQLVYHMRYLPYIGLTREHVRSVAALGARLDYDIMIDTVRV